MSSNTWKYTSEDYVVPAPVIGITVSNAIKEGLISKADFLIDTGSDISFIKNEVFSILELIIDDQVKFLPIDSDSEDDEDKYIERGLTELAIEIPEINYKEKLKVAVGQRGEDNILGRDFLNKFRIYLDGIEQEFKIHH